VNKLDTNRWFQKTASDGKRPADVSITGRKLWVGIVFLF
jgi:hypothetical protein